MHYFDDKVLNNTIVSIDIETSGSYSLQSEICELAAVKYQNGKVIDSFQSLVSVSKPMSDFIIGIHGITNEMVKDAPNVQSLIKDFTAFIDNSILIGHHIQFDLGFIAMEVEKAGLKFPSNKILCTSLLSRNIITESPNHKLQTLIKFLNLNQGKAHRALDDSNACLELFLKCLQRLDDNTTIKDLINIQDHDFRWQHFSYYDFLSTLVGTTLDRAINEKFIVEINYRFEKNKVDNWRSILPKGLVLNGKTTYLIAHCMKDLKDKRFYLDKIQAVRPTSNYLS